MSGERTWWRWRSRIATALRFAAATLLTVGFLFPIYWIFITSLKSSSEIFAIPPVWVPEEMHFENFTGMFSAGELRPIGNSLLISSLSTMLSIVIGTLAAYSLARYRIGGRALAVWIMSLRMLPPVALAFPIFLLYAAFGWVDTYHGLVILYTALNLPYVIWVMRSFIEEIPLALEESAAIDGASRWQIMRHVVFPMCRMGMLATAVFAFVFCMNEFAFAVVLTRIDVLTFTVKLSHYFGNQTTSWAWIAGLAVLGSLPVFIAVLAMQRYLVRGIGMGAVKG